MGRPVRTTPSREETLPWVSVRMRVRVGVGGRVRITVRVGVSVRVSWIVGGPRRCHGRGLG